MTNPMKWQAQSRRYFEDLLDARLQEGVRRLGQVAKNGSCDRGAIKAEMRSIKKDVCRFMDIFSIKRLHNRHDVIFRGNSKIDPNEFDLD